MKKVLRKSSCAVGLRRQPTPTNMNATDNQFAQIKTGPETATYLRRWNAMCQKMNKSIKTREPGSAKVVNEMAKLNPTASAELLYEFRESLRNEIKANYK
jgi:predicted transcriptional regulator of viral defense system